MTTRAEQKEKRKEEILLKALELFVKKGYANTKTSEISKSLHISEGLLFHYFETKEVLLDALVDIALTENTSWIDQEDIDPITYFKQVATSVFACLKEDEIASKFFILIAQMKQREGIPEKIADKISVSEKEIERTVAVLKKGQQTGVIRPGDPYALCYLFANTLQAIALQYAHRKDIPFPEVDWILDILRNHPKT